MAVCEPSERSYLWYLHQPQYKDKKGSFGSISKGQIRQAAQFASAGTMKERERRAATTDDHVAEDPVAGVMQIQAGLALLNMCNQTSLHCDAAATGSAASKLWRVHAIADFGAILHPLVRLPSRC